MELKDGTISYINRIKWVWTWIPVVLRRTLVQRRKSAIQTGSVLSCGRDTNPDPWLKGTRCGPTEILHHTVNINISWQHYWFIFIKMSICCHIYSCRCSRVPAAAPRFRFSQRATTITFYYKLKNFIWPTRTLTTINAIQSLTLQRSRTKQNKNTSW